VLCRYQQFTLRLLPAGAAVAGWVSSSHWKSALFSPCPLEHSVVLAEFLIEYTVISHGPFFQLEREHQNIFESNSILSADRVVLKD
jgi:hypothetical protein